MILLLPVSGFAMPSPRQQQTGDTSALWRARSEALTDDLLKDAGKLSDARRAVILARLARGWWTEDQTRARKWFLNAIELVEPVPNKETSDERQKRIGAARKILKVTARLDQKLTLRLVKILTPDPQISQSERNENAEWIMNSATDLVAVDPNRASELFNVAMRVGPPNDIVSFLMAMRRNDPQRADVLFTQVLSLAKQRSFTAEILNSLSYVAFPVQRGWGGNTPTPSENLRLGFLQAEIDFLNANQINDDNRTLVCASVASFIAPLLSEFDRLLPTQGVVVRQAINRCESLSPLLQQRLDDSVRPLNTSEEFLKAAADAKDEKVRTVYEYRAANLAMGAKNYELALKILDDMAKEQREFMGEAWDSYRWDWASQGAIDYYQRGQLAEMNVLLNKVPDNLRPLAKIAFLDRLPEQKDAEPGPLVEILNEALVELRRSTISEADKYNWYIALIRSTVKYQPGDAGSVLKAAVSSLNKAKAGETLEWAEFSDRIADPILAMDEFVVKDSLAAITLVETRAQLRLVLLDATLRHMKSSQN
jgi:tetratricopeptide (TPR) repeat protein